MSFAHGERHLAITSAIMMGKRHDDLFGHICIYRRAMALEQRENNCVLLIKQRQFPYYQSIERVCCANNNI
jgi:hypothetical protein